MWPFKKKSEEQSLADVLAQGHRAEQEIIFKAYPLQHEFEYMGIKMRVVHHQHYVRALISGYTCVPTIWPELKCDYIDNRGEVKTRWFTCSEVMAWGKEKKNEIS